MADNTVVGQGGGESAPLPDVVESADQLARFVEFFVKQGYNVWPLPKKIHAKWTQPIQMGDRWMVGDNALKWNWHLFLMGRVKDHFSAKITTIEQVQTSRSQGVHGLMVVKEPIRVDDLLHFFEAEGFIKRAGKA